MSKTKETTMASVNKVMLLGNLGADPDVRYTQGGTPVANFRMATTTIWNDDQGERKSRTEWHRIVVWGKQAEVAGEYLKKGSQVHIEGSLQTREWTDRDGNKRYTTEVRTQRLQLLGKPKGELSEEPPATDEPPADQEPPEDIPF